MMSVEPQNVKVAFGHAAQPILRHRTVADYHDDLRRMFGKVPSWPELAAKENIAMRQKTQQARAGEYLRTETQGDQARRALRMVSREKNIEAGRKAKAEQSARTRALIMDQLSKPCTLGDIMRATGFSERTASRVAREAWMDGLVTRTMRKKVAIWERVQ